jgi:hypothetical protein
VPRFNGVHDNISDTALQPMGNINYNATAVIVLDSAVQSVNFKDDKVGGSQRYT